MSVYAEQHSCVRVSLVQYASFFFIFFVCVWGEGRDRERRPRRGNDVTDVCASQGGVCRLCVHAQPA